MRRLNGRRRKSDKPKTKKAVVLAMAELRRQKTGTGQVSERVAEQRSFQCSE